MNLSSWSSRFLFGALEGSAAFEVQFRVEAKTALGLPSLAFQEDSSAPPPAPSSLPARYFPETCQLYRVAVSCSQARVCDYTCKLRISLHIAGFY